MKVESEDEELPFRKIFGNKLLQLIIYNNSKEMCWILSYGVPKVKNGENLLILGCL